MTQINTHNFTVRPSDCDALGHMNVARYIDGSSDAGFSVQAAWGLTPEDVQTGRKLAFVVVNLNANFFRELRVRDQVAVRSELLKLGTKSATVIHRFFRQSDGAEEEVFNGTFTLILMDLANRKSTEIPDDLRRDILAAHAMAAES